MKILLASSRDIDGGAARAAYRLHQGLQQIGASSQMLVQAKTSGDRSILAPRTQIEQGIAKARLTFDALPLKRYRNRQSAIFSVQWLPETIAAQIARLNPDVVNLHWINDAFIQVESIAKLKRPIVWSMHDMWAFTGGCHYTDECDRYTQSCGSCPQLQSQNIRDLSHSIWQRKSKAWKSADLTIVALSQWLADCARSSSLFRDSRIEVIPNGLDTTRYRPINQAFAREALGLPQDKHLALFGAMAATSDRRKGFHLLQPALQSLAQSKWNDSLELVVFGADRPQHPPEFGMKVHYLGTFQDDLSLSLLYSAADVFILPSTQENLANTVMEAMACGTPCVTFEIGGMPDLIEHQKTGYLAQPYWVDDLAQGIAWTIEDVDRHRRLSARCREKVEQEFTQSRQAHRYRSLFEDVLQRKRR
ncbi:MAG: glycosyltransferase family 4 protein [Plectolyngbya sp. WJT66-NPBG17]|jgi:glycosyltransferase involved in cell wall biosynthesis|nr:glycosyltransferase family 4 protein [Plectolyngbya sp. WJT66-NPBG17]MBW4525467.1 glycosyltransferase family 4 protein [Phormidium tanganyikae FI6-MK23]